MASQFFKKNGGSYQLLCNQWEQFGYSLKLSKDEVNSLEEKLRNGEDGNRDINIIRETLRVWKNRGEDANLKVLLDALRDLGLDELAVLVRDEFAEACPAPTSTSRRSPMSRLSLTPASWRTLSPSQADEESGMNSSLNHSFPRSLYEYQGNILLFKAIQEGRSVSEIKKIIQDHHDYDDYVNIKEDDAEDCRNAAHVVIESLIQGVYAVEQAVELLNLLVDHGFRGINDEDIHGCTPLKLLMWMDVDEPNELNDLLEWFARKGANINAVDHNGSCVLLFAIWMQNEATIMKLLEMGAIPGVTNFWGENAVHVTSMVGNCKLLKLLIDQYKLDIKKRTVDGCTPLHLLFCKRDIDYQHCLEVMLENGAQFDAKDDEGLIPLVHWIKRGASDGLFSTLMQMKEKLPITEEIASLTLTAIVKEIVGLCRYLPSPELKDDQRNDATDKEFSRFVRFLLWGNPEIKAKLLWNSEGDDENAWKENDWTELNQILNTGEFSHVLHQRTGGKVQWNRVEIVRATMMGMFGFPTSKGFYSIRAGYVLGYCLEAGMYNGFVKLCGFLKPFLKS